MKRKCEKCIYSDIHSQNIDFKANKDLFIENNNIDYVYQIIKGYFKMYRLTDSGQEIVLNILGPGDYIALVAVLQNKTTYPASSFSLTDAVIRKMDRQLILDSFNSDDLFRNNCLDCAITRASFFQFHVSQNMNIGTDEKIMKMLENLKIIFGSLYKGYESLVLPFSKTVLANLIGIRRETLSRHLKILQEKGLILVKDNLYIFT